MPDINQISPALEDSQLNPAKTEAAPEISILLIEDEEDVRESYIDMFYFLGFKIDTAENGQAGLDKVNVKHYDIVLTDLNMPVMDGLETLRRIKKRNSEIEVIVITGFATIENALGAMKQGAFDYITKPVSLDHVRIVLNKCIQQINARRENKKLRDMNTQLSELNELKNKFITITNHELRTPLAVLKGYFDLLEMEVESNSSEELSEYMQIIRNTMTEMIDMIENMHVLSTVEVFHEKHQKTLFDINLAVKVIFKEVFVLFEKRKIHFKFNPALKPVFVYADEKLIKRALRELAQNALKFTKENGQVTITVKDIEIRDQVFIMVEDNGVGIPHDKIQYIFEPFYEVQNEMHHFTSKTDFMGGGIGVGLSLVKEIIESSDGEIAVESTPEKGSVFTVILAKASAKTTE